MKYLSPLLDNAMFYKDLTQWMRNQTFLGLFILLLALGWAATAFIAFLPFDPGGRGPVLFGLLAAGLGLYTLVVAFQGFTLTSREFVTRTFELYELSGMSLERMVLGKLWSLLAQFLFGFFCVVPFLFVAFLLGGVDFLDIVGATASSLLFTVPLFLATLLASVTSKGKAVGTVGRILLVLFLIWSLPSLIFGLISHSYGGGSGVISPGRTITLLLTLDLDTWKSLGVLLLFYVQICLLFFYLACNAIAPSTDSRELPVKLLFTTLALSWMVKWSLYFRRTGDTESLYFMAVPLYLLLLLLGLVWFYHRLDPPIMDQDRRAAARTPWRRAAHLLFAPGAAGTLRTLAALWAACLLVLVYTTLASASVPTGYRADPFYSPLRAFSLPLSVPYFLAVPALFFRMAPAFRRNHKKLRTLVVVWWLAAGVVISILYAVTFSFRAYGGGRGGSGLVEILAALASPLSSATLGYSDTSALYHALPGLRVLLGVVGMVALFGMLARAAREERERRAKAEPAAAVESGE